MLPLIEQRFVRPSKFDMQINTYTCYNIYHMMLQLLPNDLIAIILEYTLDKRHDIMLLQYDISTNRIYYKINY